MKFSIASILIAILLQVGNVVAQGSFNFAHKQYDRMKYAHAIEHYEKALKFLSPTPVVLKNLANSYYNIGDMRNAERVYSAFFEDTTGVAEKDERAIFEYAQTLAQNGHYEKSVAWFEKYVDLTGHRDERGKAFLEAYSQRINDFYKDSVNYSVKKVNFNSGQSDFSPVFYGDGIVFCSSRKQEHGIRRVHSWNNSAFLDLYYLDTAGIKYWPYETDMYAEDSSSKKYSYTLANKGLHSDETYSTSNDSYTVGYYAHTFKEDKKAANNAEPTLFSPKINTKFHDGPATFNKEQNMIIFTRNNYNKFFAKRDGMNVTRLKLYIAYKDEDSGDWGKVTEFPFNSDEYSVGHPSLSADGKTLYFSSDMPGGKGGSDIYKSAFRNGKWSKPVNLGSKVNTPGNELFPYIDEKDVLYFSSNGHPGLGGLDIFKYEKDQVSHLNYPISSKKDDFGIVLWDKGKKGFLSSNRDFGGFDDDIYMFTAVKTIMLEGTVRDKITMKELPGTKISLTDNNGKEVASVRADSVGQYQLELDFDEYYQLSASRRSYFDTTEAFNTVNVTDKQIRHDLYMWNKIDVALVGLVTDRETGEPIDSVHVIIKDKNTHKEIFSLHTLSNGIFREMLEELRVKDSIGFNIHLVKTNYLTRSIPFNTIVSDTVVNLHKRLDLVMDKIKVGTDIGKIFNLNPIYFDLGKWDIRSDAASELDKIVEVMNENKGIIIELGAHTDCRGSAASNLSLSDKRAKASAEYIISKGIDEDRIYGKGYGESRLINHCGCEGTKIVKCSEDEHALNRRTEFLVVKTSGM